METKSPSALGDHLGYWLRLVSNHVSGAFAEKLSARGISVAEWVLLRELYDRAQPPSLLADRLDMTRGAITKLADRLLARKLILRAASALDGRAQTLSLTGQGRALVPQLAALADHNDAEFFAGLSGRDQAALKSLLLKIVRGRDLRGVPTE
ncbi:MAG TPA: MarR family transcriptional regulator [Rhizomicrobium sp.]|jgi:DNA-binding MarR family transcriptional regulator|nr:MarR family transcriptional regulator [Rhizomicrobium sp.]